MPEIIFAMAGCLFVFFVIWLTCCFWQLTPAESVAERLIYVTKQFGKRGWFIIYFLIVSSMLLITIRMLQIEINAKQPTQQKIVYKTDEALQKKVDIFLREHKRARKYFK